MTGRSTTWGRAAQGMRAAAAVVAIVGASVIGLHDWADGAATHQIVPKQIVRDGAAT